jgi:hypothetical protein
VVGAGDKLQHSGAAAAQKSRPAAKRMPLAQRSTAWPRRKHVQCRRVSLACVHAGTTTNRCARAPHIAMCARACTRTQHSCPARLCCQGWVQKAPPEDAMQCSTTHSAPAHTLQATCAGPLSTSMVRLCVRGSHTAVSAVGTHPAHGQHPSPVPHMRTTVSGTTAVHPGWQSAGGCHPRAACSAAALGCCCQLARHLCCRQRVSRVPQPTHYCPASNQLLTRAESTERAAAAGWR